jgi:hypothetical protein
MFGFFEDILDFLINLFKRLWKEIQKLFAQLGPILPLLIILAFVIAPALGAWLATSGIGWVSTMGSFINAGGLAIEAWGTYALLAVGVGTAAVVFPDETAELVETVGDVVTQVAGEVGEAVGAASGGLLTGLADSGALWWILGGLAVYWFVTRDDGPEYVTVQNEGSKTKENV